MSSIRKFLDRHGKVTVDVAQDEDDILGCDYVICVLAPPLYPLVFPDNVFDFCAKCDRKVQLRPYVPPGPKRICYDCMSKETESEDEVHTLISPKTAAELADYLVKRRRS